MIFKSEQTSQRGVALRWTGLFNQQSGRQFAGAWEQLVVGLNLVRDGVCGDKLRGTNHLQNPVPDRCVRSQTAWSDAIRPPGVDGPSRK